MATGVLFILIKRSGLYFGLNLWRMQNQHVLFEIFKQYMYGVCVNSLNSYLFDRLLIKPVGLLTVKCIMECDYRPLRTFCSM